VAGAHTGYEGVVAGVLEQWRHAAVTVDPIRWSDVEESVPGGSGVDGTRSGGSGSDGTRSDGTGTPATVSGMVATSAPGPSVPDPLSGVVETHASVLVFMGPTVYKLRKPVHFGFLDFREPADRLADCRREVALNRRLAPDVYLGVADLVLDGSAIDHAVVMRRLPRERSLAVLAGGHTSLGPEMRRIAQVLARFHASADRSDVISSVATPEALTSAWKTNFAECEPFVGSVLEPGVEGEIRVRALRWIAGRGPLLATRIAQGAICDGHGDLQADDVFCLDDGVRILDCLEFDDRLRFGDVVADLAFLVMDLRRLGRSDLGQALVTEYETASGSAVPRSLLEHYCALRAYVRAKVACLRMSQGVPELASSARALQRQALDHLRAGAVSLVLVGGLPGSGKSTLTAALAGALGGRAASTDTIRAELFGREGDAPGYRTGRYDAAATERTYHEMLRRARPMLEHGEPVVLDASWTDAGRRGEARALARATSSELVELCCEVSDPVARRRLLERGSSAPAASEATEDVRRAMRHDTAPWPEATVIDTGMGRPADALSRAMRVVRALRHAPPTRGTHVPHI